MDQCGDIVASDGIRPDRFLRIPIERRLKVAVGQERPARTGDRPDFHAAGKIGGDLRQRLPDLESRRWSERDHGFYVRLFDQAQNVFWLEHPVDREHNGGGHGA